MNGKIRQFLKNRKSRIERRLDKKRFGDTRRPVFTAANIHYEVADRCHGLAHGGIGAVHRHGGGLVRHDLEPDLASAPQPRENLIALDQALDQLAAEDPVKAELVKLRYFAGLTLAEAAEALGMSERTAGRHWTFARAWLRRAVEKLTAEDAGDDSLIR